MFVLLILRHQQALELPRICTRHANSMIFLQTGGEGIHHCPMTDLLSGVGDVVDVLDVVGLCSLALGRADPVLHLHRTKRRAYNCQKGGKEHRSRSVEDAVEDKGAGNVQIGPC